MLYCAICCRPSVRPSVCLSVTRVDQSKTVEVRIMQLSPQSSPVTLVSSWLMHVTGEGSGSKAGKKEGRKGRDGGNVKRECKE